MQQLLERRLTNTPTDTSLVRGNCGVSLNKRETASVASLKTSNNNPEENHLRVRSGGSDLRVQNRVYVLNMRGKPLMPTCQAKARRLLKGGKAKVFKRFPFTIQLMIATGETKQPITLKQDTGYKFIGMSAVTNKAELFAAEVTLRTDIVKLLSERRMYRRNRRYRLWYRKQRYENKKCNGLMPSIQHRLYSHLRVVEEVCAVLPINSLVVEVAAFDIQKIKNPGISGTEYQEGVQKNFWNVREYVLYRDSHTCQYCAKKGVVLNVHHLESQMTGGNSPDNLITLCEDCHEKYHQGKIALKVKKSSCFKAETAMSIIRWRLLDELSKRFAGVSHSYGYITKANRVALGLEKTHANDAFCVGTVSGQERTFIFYLFQKRKNNRCLQINRPKYGISIRRQRYKIQPWDIVTIRGKKYVSKGTSTRGKELWILKNGKPERVGIKKVDKILNVKTLVWN